MYRERRERNSRSHVPPVTPVLTSVTEAQADALGGSSHALVGTGFTLVAGASGVRFGVINAASYVVNSDTSITAVAPAHAVGAYEITVADGPRVSNGVAFESWDPTVPATPTLLAEAPNYAIVSTTGTLAARVGAPLVGVTTGDVSHPDDGPPTGTPKFVRANKDRLISASTWATLIGLSHSVPATLAIAFDVVSLPAGGAYDFLISDDNTGSGAYCVIEYGSDGTIYWGGDFGGYVFATTTGLVVGRNVIIAQKVPNGSTCNLKVRVNGGAYGALQAAADLANTGDVTLGSHSFSNHLYRLDAKVIAVVSAKANWTAPEEVKFATWLRARHPAP